MAATIRRAGGTDRDLLNMLHRLLYQEYRGRILPPGVELLYAYKDFTDILRQDVAAMLREPSCVLFVAEDSGEPLGYITGRVEDTPRRVLERKGVLQDWFVVDERRGEGIGRALFDALVTHFKQAGCRLIESATWPFNRVARDAHEALGFKETEIRYRRLID